MADKEESAAFAELQIQNEVGARAVLVRNERLRSTISRVSLLDYLNQVWRYRKFIVEHSRHRAIADNDDMFLGKLWMLLEPLLRIAMYGLLFGLLLRTSRGIDNFIGFLIIGLTYFSMLSRGLGGGAGVIQRSRALMRTFQFPRASLVLGEALRSFFSNLIPALLAVLAALAFQIGKPVSWTVVLVVPLILLINIFAFGLMLFVARITAFVPDAKKIVFFVNRAWFYVSGVFFSVERYASVPVLQDIMMENPAYRFLQAVRGAVLYGTAPSLSDWLILFAWSAGTVLVGFVYFWKAEDRYVHVR